MSIKKLSVGILSVLILSCVFVTWENYAAFAQSAPQDYAAIGTTTMDQTPVGDVAVTSTDTTSVSSNNITDIVGTTTDVVSSNNQAGVGTVFGAAPASTVITAAAQIPTTLSVTPYTIAYEGGSFSLTATMTPAVAGKQISFYLVNTSLTGITTAYTNTNGVAVVNGMNAGGVINAGDYPTGINAGFAGDSTYAASNATADLNILKANQTIQFYTTLSDRPYGSPDFSFGGLSTSGGTVVFTASGVCTMAGQFTAHITGAGVCTITANQPGDVNWNAAPQVSKSFNVTPIPITITADAKSKVYGSPDPVFTYSITSGSLLSGDSLYGSLTRAPGENIGVYPILQGTLTGGNNYVITYVGANLTIGKLAVVLSGSRVYDGTNTVSYSVLSVANKIGTDDISVASGTATLAGAGVGTQNITSFGDLTLGGTSAGNYTMTGATGSVSITKATPVITWANPADIYYGTALSTVQLNATSSVPGIFTYTPDVGTVLPVGLGQTLSVAFAPTDSTDYNSANATTTINVNASLCVTGADTNGDGTISINEILAYVLSWKIGTVTTTQILQAVGFWKTGVGC